MIVGFRPGSALSSNAADVKIRHDDQMATYKALRAYLLHYYSEEFLDEVEWSPNNENYVNFFTKLKQDLRIKP